MSRDLLSQEEIKQHKDLLKDLEVKQARYRFSSGMEPFKLRAQAGALQRELDRHEELKGSRKERR